MVSYTASTERERGGDPDSISSATRLNVISIEKLRVVSVVLAWLR